MTSFAGMVVKLKGMVNASSINQPSKTYPSNVGGILQVNTHYRIRV
jgi:hypothetical protein